MFWPTTARIEQSSTRGFLDAPRGDGLLEAFEAPSWRVGFVRRARRSRSSAPRTPGDHHHVASASFTRLNTAFAVPGTPTIPVPSTLIKHTSSMVARPLTSSPPARAAPARTVVVARGHAVDDRRARRGLVEVVASGRPGWCTSSQAASCAGAARWRQSTTAPTLRCTRACSSNRFLDTRGSALVHAVDVRPDRDVRRDEQRAEDGGGVIRAVALERRRDAVRRARDEPGGDEIARALSPCPPS